MITTAQQILICRHAIRKVPVGRIATLVRLDPDQVAEILDQAGFPDSALVRAHHNVLVEIEREIRGLHVRPVISVEALVRAGHGSTKQKTRTLAKRLESVSNSLTAALAAEKESNV